MIGQHVEPADFDAIYKDLPTVPPEDAYESRDAYRSRLNTVDSTGNPKPLILRVNRSPALYYNPDKQALSVYKHQFGFGSTIDYGQVMRLARYDLFDDPSGIEIAFQLSEKKTGTEVYDATNGFGVHVMVEKTTQESTALFERYEKAGKDYFTGMKRYGPVDIPMSAERARMIIDKGGPAILFTPKAPYRQEGVSRIAPTYSSAHEVIDHVRFIHADIHCVLLLDEHENIFAAFGVR